MKKRTSIRVIFTAIFAVIAWLWLFNEVAAQLISVFFVLAVPSVVLARNIEKTGMRTLLFALEPGPLGLMQDSCGKKFAESVSWLCNTALEFVCDKVGIETPVSIGNETALTLFFGQFLLLQSCCWADLAV